MKREDLRTDREWEIYRSGYSAGNSAKNYPSKKKDKIKKI